MYTFIAVNYFLKTLCRVCITLEFVIPVFVMNIEFAINLPFFIEMCSNFYVQGVGSMEIVQNGRNERKSKLLKNG